MNYDHNVYYYPEASGLKLIGVLDEPDMSYAYHTLIVLQGEADGQLYWAEDSGCSCPTPFEDFTLENLPKLNRDNFSDFKADVEAFDSYDGQSRLDVEKAELLHAVKRILDIYE